MTQHRTGFSLIELLVVMAVMTVLMALVIPIASMITQSAEAAKCASNLRQLGTALLAFTNDNRGRIPPPNISNDADVDLNRNGIKDADDEAFGRDKGNWWGFLRTYLPDIELSSVFLCPTGTWDELNVRTQMDAYRADPWRSFEADCTWYQSSYGYNAELGVGVVGNEAVFPGGNRAWMSWRLSKITQVSETPAITETWSVGEKAGSPGVTEVVKLPFFRASVDPVSDDNIANYTFDWNRMAAIRVTHRLRANHVFFDGSVRCVNPITLGAGSTPGDTRYWGTPNAYRGKY